MLTEEFELNWGERWEQDGHRGAGRTQRAARTVCAFARVSETWPSPVWGPWL